MDDGKGYQRVDDDPKHAAVRKRFDEILADHPGLTADNPYFQTRKGAKWLQSYTEPGAVAKHLHNHKDYQFYEETLPPQTGTKAREKETSKWDTRNETHTYPHRPAAGAAGRAAR